MPAFTLQLEIRRSSNDALYVTQSMDYANLSVAKINVIRARAGAWLSMMESFAGAAAAQPGRLCDIRLTALVDGAQVAQQTVSDLKVHRVRAFELFDDWMVNY